MPHIGIDEPEFDYVEVPIRDGVAMLEGVAFPINPMIGTIGVAHPQGGFTRSAGDWGGNLDTSSIIKGSKLFLPVFVVVKQDNFPSFDPTYTVPSLIACSEEPLLLITRIKND